MFAIYLVKSVLNLTFKQDIKRKSKLHKSQIKYDSRYNSWAVCSK